MASEPAATAKQVKALEKALGPLPPDYQELIVEATELELKHKN